MKVSPDINHLLRQFERAYSAFLLVVGLVVSFSSTALYAAGTSLVFSAAGLGLLILLFFNAHFICGFILGRYLAPSVRNLFIIGLVSFSSVAFLGLVVLTIAAKEQAVDLMIRSMIVYVLIGEAGSWGFNTWVFRKNHLSHRL
jgi:hypothetical protein